MESILPNKLEAILLLEELHIPDSGMLMRLLNEYFASTGGSFQSTKFSRGNNFLHLQGMGLTIELYYVSSPVSPIMFETTLASAKTNSDFLGAQYAVQGHASYMHAKVINGNVEPHQPFMESDEPEPAAFDVTAFNNSVLLLKNILMIHISAYQPMAVYWAQSDRLLGLPFFLKMAVEPKDQSLLVHLKHDDQEESPNIFTYGASTLLGKEVSISDRELPIGELEAILMHFVSLSCETGLILPDGDTFGRDQGEVIKVHHTRTSEGPFLTLVCEHNEAFGIDRRAPLPDEEELTINLHDPAERAMQELIERKKRNSEKQTEEMSGSETNSETAELDASANNVWTGVKKKVDVASLRSLAGKMADEPGSKSKSSKQTSEKTKKAGRLGGLFSKS